MVERGRQQMRVWRMRIACWITLAKYTHLEYVILIAFPLQEWLGKSTSKIRCMYIACLAYCTPKCNRFDVLVIIVFL